MHQQYEFVRLCSIDLRSIDSPGRRSHGGDFQQLLEDMSPQLRGAVALQMNAGWIARLPVFARCPQEARERTKIFPPDAPSPAHLHIHKLHSILTHRCHAQ